MSNFPRPRYKLGELLRTTNIKIFREKIQSFFMAPQIFSMSLYDIRLYFISYVMMYWLKCIYWGNTRLIKISAADQKLATHLEIFQLFDNVDNIQTYIIWMKIDLRWYTLQLSWFFFLAISIKSQYLYHLSSPENTALNAEMILILRNKF